MFRIGAFSKLTRVSVRMLRYYDNAGLLTPAVIDKFTGYRMYTTDQIPVLQKICLLRDMGFNVTEIGAVMECWESSGVTEYLEDKKRQLLDSIRLEQQRIRKIEIAMRDFKESTIETLKNNIEYSMKQKGIEKLEVGTFKAGYRKSESVEIINLDVIPADFTKVEIKADKTAIKKAIKAGEVVEGAEIKVNQNFYIK